MSNKVSGPTQQLTQDYQNLQKSFTSGPAFGSTSSIAGDQKVQNAVKNAFQDYQQNFQGQGKSLQDFKDNYLHTMHPNDSPSPAEKQALDDACSDANLT